MDDEGEEDEGVEAGDEAEANDHAGDEEKLKC